MTTFGSYQKSKTVAALSSFVSAVSKTYPEIYIKFKTATKSPTPNGVGLFVLRADSNNLMQGSGGALLAMA